MGDVKYAEDLGAAVVKTDKGRVTVFANGHIMVIAGKEESEALLDEVCTDILRVQMCTGCKICEKNCPRGAIKIAQTIVVDEKKCNRCGKCANGCIAADRAARIISRLRKTNRES